MISFTTFYGMRMNPFDKELPSRDAYKTLDMEQMQGRLEHLKAHPGIGMFTASPGMGKTFALRYFSDSLNPNLVRLCYICLSTVTASEFYRQLCVALGLEVSYKKRLCSSASRNTSFPCPQLKMSTAWSAWMKLSILTGIYYGI